MTRVWPLPKYRDGRAPRISDGFHTGTDVRAGKAKRPHLGVDVMYRRPVAGIPVLPNLSKHYECLPDTPILACGDGLVLESKEVSKGGYILIDHEDGTASQYMHLARRDVALGDRVLAGVTIGLAGFNPSAGKGAYALRHLHFQYREGFKSIRESGRRVDPAPLMATWEIMPWPG